MNELMKRIMEVSKLFEDYMATVMLTLEKMNDKVDRIEKKLMAECFQKISQ